MRARGHVRLHLISDIFYVNFEVVSDEEEPGSDTWSAAGEVGAGTAEAEMAFMDVPSDSQIKLQAGSRLIRLDEELRIYISTLTVDHNYDKLLQAITRPENGRNDSRQGEISLSEVVIETAHVETRFDRVVDEPTVRLLPGLKGLMRPQRVIPAPMVHPEEIKLEQKAA